MPGIVLVGAGLAGVRTAEQLRRAGHSGPITMLGAEVHPPYDRPPLSKEVLRGDRTAADVVLQDTAFFADNQVELRTGVRAIGVDTEKRLVSLENGPAVPYEELVIATGLVPRQLPAAAGLAGLHVLRTVDHSLRIRESVGSGPALIVGAGFIGCEVAASLRALSVPVTIVDPLPAPLAGAVGETIGRLVARLHVEAGVDLRCGVGVAEILDDGAGRVSGVKLSDGTEIAAHLIVSGIGSRPAVEWLAGSAIEVANGITCDERGRTSADGVWALGDVAAWFRPALGKHVRVEHWTNAGEQASVVASDIVGGDQPTRPPVVPYFWSDQYGLKIQALGDIDPSEEVRVLTDDGRRFLAVYVNDGRITGAVGCGRAGQLMKLRPLIARQAALSEIPQ
ncbi:NAD(P)/FAD-dependent oxidoreductase [Fodinicola feengrottensis]|uniref:NAD(P)/FAD-dependent oxidoreductase n=1 Tax=Fodinicola feengrottensis TaxID=435914 RepID=UPI0013D50B0B|nr:FAD-dependent oxidoreductase [Fodinicola feengrottensis]